MSASRLAAIVLAAGFSSRMRAHKPLLSLDGETVLSSVVRLFGNAGCFHVAAVLGREAETVRPEAEAAGAEVVLNPDYAEGMFSSVLAGVRALPPETDAFFVLPVDIPLVRPATLDAVKAAFRPGDDAVLCPAFRGEPGHPPLVPRALVSLILSHDGRAGLAGALAKAPGGTRRVPVHDAGVLLDMDHPWDYLRVLSRYGRREIPTREECASFFETMPERGRAHARAVAVRAERMAAAVNARRAPQDALDAELVRAAALLHDIAKGQPRHEAAGGRLLASWGFGRAGEIAAAHKDPVPGEGAVDEREIVALADKLVRCDDAVSIEERFGEKLRLYGDDPEAAAAIRGRLANALRVRDRIETEIGCSLDDLFDTGG